jgi:hypothetical protein
LAVSERRGVRAYFWLLGLVERFGDPLDSLDALRESRFGFAPCRLRVVFRGADPLKVGFQRLDF